jgi:hypothetical protein
MVEGDGGKEREREKMVEKGAYRKAWQATSNWSANMKWGWW